MTPDISKPQPDQPQRDRIALVACYVLTATLIWAVVELIVKEMR